MQDLAPSCAVLLSGPEQLPNEEVQAVVSRVWPAVLSNLKSMLETGTVVLTPPLCTLNMGRLLITAGALAGG
jgi:hypothetical protein